MGDNDWYTIDRERYPDYMVYEDGRIYSIKKNKFLIPQYRDGYLYTSLIDRKEGRRRTIGIHRAVAMGFIANFKNHPQVNHKNGIKTDNNWFNLEWVTNTENSIHAVKTGLRTGKTRPVIQFTNEGHFVERFDSIISAAKKMCHKTSTKNELNSTANCIGRACAKENHMYYNYIWRYEVEDIIEDIEGEEWIDINSYENYQISNMGRIYNSDTGKLLNPKTRPDGYRRVRLGKKPNRKPFYIHVLVAQHFLEVPSDHEKIEVNHLNRVKEDNRDINLEWVTRSENIQHMIDTGENNILQPVIQYDSKGNEVARYPSIKKASEATGSQSISAACIYGYTVYGYFWRHEDDPLDKKDIENGLIRAHKHAVKQYSLNAEYIKTFSSITEAAQSINVDSKTIDQACNLYYMSGGYLWRFEEDNTPVEKYVSTTGAIKVVQYNMNTDKRIKIWNSMNEASRTLGISSGHISSVCNRYFRNETTGRAQAGGFIWRFYNE